MSKKQFYILLYIVIGLIVYYLIYKYWYLPMQSKNTTPINTGVMPPTTRNTTTMGATY